MGNGQCREVSMKAEAAAAAPSAKEFIENWEERTAEKSSAALVASDFSTVDLKLMASPGKTVPLTKEKVMEMAGVSGPLGLFDPFGISTKVPEGQLLFFREAELKHGRVCMLAILGLIVGERHDFIPLLGNGVGTDVPAYLLGTPYAQQTPIAQFWPLALAAVGFEEYRRATLTGQDVENLQQPSSPAPGDYGWDPLGLKPKNEKELKELQTKELNNGRLAMFAAAGIIAQEQLTGKNQLFR